MEYKYRQDKYDATNSRRFNIKLNRKTDAELIEKLESVDNIQRYIKELVSRDLEIPLFLKVIEKKITEGFTLKDVGTFNSGESFFRFANMEKGSAAIKVIEAQDGSGRVNIEEDGSVIE